MATINIELNPIPVNISENLVNGTFYSVQLISTLGAAAHYLLVDGLAFPDVPPKRAHLLIKHRHVELKVAAGESFWAWVGAGVEAVFGRYCRRKCEGDSNVVRRRVSTCT